MITAQQVYEAIAHGDDEHRDWLREACENIFAGRAVPEPRGKNTSAALLAENDALRAENERLKEALRESGPHLRARLVDLELRQEYGVAERLRAVVTSINSLDASGDGGKE